MIYRIADQEGTPMDDTTKAPAEDTAADAAREAGRVRAAQLLEQAADENWLGV